MKRFIRSIPGKVTLFIATVLSLCIAAAGILGVAFMAGMGFYSTPKETIKQDLIWSSLSNDADQITMDAIHYSGENIHERPSEDTNFIYELCDDRGEIISRSYGVDHSSEGSDWWDYHFYIELVNVTATDPEGVLFEEYSYVNRITQTRLDSETWQDPDNFSGYTYKNTSAIYEIFIVLKPGLPALDVYSIIHDLVDFGYSMRQSVFALIGASALLAIICFIALMCASARRYDTDEPVPGVLHKVPYDLMLFAFILAAVGLVFLIDELRYGEAFTVILTIVYGIVMTCFTLGMCMSLAARLKTGTLFSNTLICYCLRQVLRFCRWSGRTFRHFLVRCREIFHTIPMIWRTVLIVSVLSLLEFVLIVSSHWEVEVLLTFWFLEKLVLVPVILYIAYTMKTLQQGGIALASGDLGHQIDTSRMLWDFKRHGENLNSISDGMAVAVEQRLRSERMRTELITNVSHDIKTPLTSIINYADLIGKEICRTTGWDTDMSGQMDSVTASEADAKTDDNTRLFNYSQVLLRQSDRLKRLIDDLVEASKASTGNLDVLLAPCDAEIFISQISGEYEQKLANAGLTLITRQPEESVRVLADGRRMLRIFDNLMNNICKYAQRGTRVYLTLEQKGTEAVITFRNISQMALDISEEELMERFVRGDSSRNTEGSGLGLSIARSLTELQKGRMELSIDGDLFKVILYFPLLSSHSTAEQPQTDVFEHKPAAKKKSHLPLKKPIHLKKLLKKRH